MSWLPRWLGERYGKLYAQFGEGLFDFAQAKGTLGTSDKILLNVLSQLKRRDHLCVFGRDDKHRVYRLFSPELIVLAPQVGVKNIGGIKQGRYPHLLVKLVLELHKKYRENLASVVVFGSVARGTAQVESDVDTLVVSKGFNGSLASRIGELLEVEHKTFVADELRWLSGAGISTHISFHPYTPKEMGYFRMLFLDILADGIALFDREKFFESLRAKFKGLLDRLGAERNFISRDKWFWVMNPEAQLGEIET